MYRTLHSGSLSLSEVSKGHCTVSSPILSLLYEDEYYHNMISRSDTLHICIPLMNVSVFSHKEVGLKCLANVF